MGCFCFIILHLPLLKRPTKPSINELLKSYAKVKPMNHVLTEVEGLEEDQQDKTIKNMLDWNI